MKLHEHIAAIQAAMAGRGATGDAGGARVHSTTGVPAGRRMFDTLATQFNTHIGASVFCLPMGDATGDAALGAASCLPAE